MAEKKVKLLNQAGEELYPRTTMDNILTAVGSTVYANLVKLNGLGKIDAEYLPSYVDDVVELIAMTGTAPATCAKGDFYFNTTSNKIFEATAVDTWATTGTDPEKGVIYVDTSSEKIYRWADTQMFEISQQVATVNVVTSNSTDEYVPTALATYKIASTMAQSATVGPAGSAGVADALGGVYVGSNINVNAGTISVASGAIGTAGIVALASATSAASTDTTDSSTAVTPKGLASALAGYQTKFTTSSGITINGATITVATGSAGLGLTYVPTAANSNGVAVTNTNGTVSIAGVAATSTGNGVVRLASSTEAIKGSTVTGAVVLSPKQTNDIITSHLASYQSKFTASSNVSINGTTISVPDGNGSKGLVYIAGNTNNNGVAITNNAATVSIAGVDATAGGVGVVRLASSTEAVKGTTVTGAVVLNPSQVDSLITSHLGSYQSAFTTSSNITINGTTIAVATGTNNGTKGVLAVDTTSSNGAALSVTGGTVKVTMATATVGSAGAIAIASDSNVKGPYVSNGTYYAGNFSGTNTAVNPAQLGSALGIAVFYQEL